MEINNTDTAKKILGQWLNDEVLDAFDILFPERTPRLRDTIDEIRHSGGQRSVVLFLKGLKHG